MKKYSQNSISKSQLSDTLVFWKELKL